MSWDPRWKNDSLDSPYNEQEENESRLELDTNQDLSDFGPNE